MWPPISESDPVWHSVDIFDVTPVLIALAMSGIVSTLFLALEVLHQHMGRKKECICYLKLYGWNNQPLTKNNESRARGVFIQAHKM